MSILHSRIAVYIIIKYSRLVEGCGMILITPNEAQIRVKRKH